MWPVCDCYIIGTSADLESETQVMPRKVSVISAIALLSAPATGLAKAGDPIPNSYICTFTPGPISSGSEARISVAAVGGRIKHVYSRALNGFSAHMPAAAVQKLLAKNRLISGCTQDRVASIPPTLVGEISTRGGPPGGGAASQTMPWGVKRVGGGANSSGTAWIIDTGIDRNHPDLNVSGTGNVDFIAGGAVANDPNGHGTHVAGIIGAINNSFGVVGVAAGARLVSVRVLDQYGNGSDSDVIAGIDHVITNGAPGDVINLSLITDPLATLDQAVVNAAKSGFYIAIAAGNSSANAGNYSPARAGCAEAGCERIYTVSAIDSKGVFARYSNWGNPPIDYAEPGSSILSTYKNGTYATLSGTSMAAPHLAGILLLHGGTPPAAGGQATRDPDGTADPIGVN